jgi:hypothetical protein
VKRQLGKAQYRLPSISYRKCSTPYPHKFAPSPALSSMPFTFTFTSSRAHFAGCAAASTTNSHTSSSFSQQSRFRHQNLPLSLTADHLTAASPAPCQTSRSPQHYLSCHSVSCRREPRQDRTSHFRGSCAISKCHCPINRANCVRDNSLTSLLPPESTATCSTASMLVQAESGARKATTKPSIILAVDLEHTTSTPAYLVSTVPFTMKPRSCYTSAMSSLSSATSTPALETISEV